MRRRDAEKNFKEADDLFRGGETYAALRLLREIDDAFPGQPRVLYPIARCLERLGEDDEALAICDRLANVHFYERAGRAAERIRSRRAQPASFTPAVMLSDGGDQYSSDSGQRNSASHARYSPLDDEPFEELPHAPPPITALLSAATLVAAVVGTALGYLNLLTGGVIVVATAAYLGLVFVPGIMMRRMSLLPLKAKGRALAGAIAQVKSVMPAPPPSDTLRREPGAASDGVDWRAVEARVKARGWQFYFIDVVIAPAPAAGPAEPWVPTALRLIPAGNRLRTPSDLEQAFPVYSVRVFVDGQWCDDIENKCFGPIQLRLHAALDPKLDDLAFAYYLESFGAFRRSARVKPAV